MLNPVRALALAATLTVSGAAAVELSADGRGQALLFPYYTVRSVEGDAFHTYLSIANIDSAAGKALRVRFREARAGKQVASFNLFLGPRDIWTGAVVPDGEGTRLITTDASCADPAFGPDLATAGPPAGLAFSRDAYTGIFADGNGDGLERTREGYVEVFEMGTLAGASNDAAQHTTSGFPADCRQLRPRPAVPLGAPGGGLSGTLTLINVASGVDITVAADALADLATRPYFAPIGDEAPSFAAAEIDPVSVVRDGPYTYRSTWERGLDAVSAVFMRAAAMGEFTQETVTRSRTDFVVTMPTWVYLVSSSQAQAPFTRVQGVRCEGLSGESLALRPLDRNQALRTRTDLTDYNGYVPLAPRICGATANFRVYPLDYIVTAPALGTSSPGTNFGVHLIQQGTQSGWLETTFPATAPLASLPSSQRLDARTGDIIPGRHIFTGFPVTGFSARVLVNGTLSCGAEACQGNYGAAFPLKYRRAIAGGS